MTTQMWRSLRVFRGSVMTIVSTFLAGEGDAAQWMAFVLHHNLGFHLIVSCLFDMAETIGDVGRFFGSNYGGELHILDIYYLQWMM